MPHFHPSPLHVAQRANRVGFTLIELAIVLTIIAVIMGGGLSIYADKLQAGRVEETRNRLDRVEDALKLYVQTYGTLPCPARGDAGIDEVSSNPFGRQDCAGGHPNAYYAFGNGTRAAACWGSGNVDQARYTLVGVVPTRTLSIPDAYAFDGWNNRIMYVVDNNYTRGVTSATTCWNTDTTAAGAAAIIIQDANGNEKTNCGGDCAAVGPGARAVYVLFSYGANGFGAWANRATSGIARRNISTIGTIGGGPIEETNAHITVPQFNNIFRDATITYSDTTATYFDDFVRWKTAYQF